MCQTWHVSTSSPWPLASIAVFISRWNTMALAWVRCPCLAPLSTVFGPSVHFISEPAASHASAPHHSSISPPTMHTAQSSRSPAALNAVQLFLFALYPSQARVRCPLGSWGRRRPRGGAVRCLQRAAIAALSKAPGRIQPGTAQQRSNPQQHSPIRATTNTSSS
jgi:hypothetical protein